VVEDPSAVVGVGRLRVAHGQGSGFGHSTHRCPPRSWRPEGAVAAAPPPSRIFGGCSLGSAVWAAERLLDDLQRLALRGPGRVEFFDEAAARLKRTLSFDGACWHTLDPG